MHLKLVEIVYNDDQETRQNRSLYQYVVIKVKRKMGILFYSSKCIQKNKENISQTVFNCYEHCRMPSAWC